MTPIPPFGYSNEPPFQACRDGAFIFFVQLLIFAQVPKKYSVVSERFIGKKILHDGARFLGACAKTNFTKTLQ